MSSTGTRIAWPLRAWLAVEVMFGVAASLSIGVSPAEAATNFAWPIQPAVMAAFLGAFYLTTAPLFVLPLFAKRWEAIRPMVLPTVLFTTVQLIATFLHWDKFRIDSTPFYVWFASYLLPPPIFLAAYLWQQRRSARAPAPAEDRLPAWLRQALIAGGLLLLAAATAIFAFPQLLIPYFAWKLTPLTARSFCGWLMLVGAMLLSIAREDSRERSRLASPMLFLIFPVLLFQLSRFSEQVSWGNPLLWLLLAICAAAGALGLYLARGSWRQSIAGPD
jgi:hypothetical protein